MNPRSFLIIAFIVTLSSVVFAQTQSFQVAGVSRNFILHAPSGLNNPPLVFILHGYNMDGASMQSITQMDKIADRDKFIVVYPNAINKSWDYSSANVDDFTFVLAIIDTIDAKYHIDRNRIYVAGFSQGAGMCNSLGCKYSDIFAAIAPVSGGLGATCTLKRPVPVFMTFGTKDMSTPATFMTSVTKWVQLDSCPATPTVTRPYPSSNPQSVVTRLTYGPGKNGVLVIADSILGGPHEWPMDTKTKVNNSEEAWAFFKQFSLNGTTAIHRQTIPAGRDGIRASYSSGIIRLQGAGEKCQVRVSDTKGRVIATGLVVQCQCSFKGKPGGVYVVMMNAQSGPVAIRMVIP